MNGLFSRPTARLRNQNKAPLNKDFTYSSYSLFLLAFFTFAGMVVQDLYAGYLPLREALTVCCIALFSGFIVIAMPIWLTTIAIILALWGIHLGVPLTIGLIPTIFLSVGFIFSSSFQYVQHWDQVVILRAGVFRKVRGAGLFFLFPFLDRIAAFVDTRIRAADFNVEKTLTGDTVPVDVDALAFWMVWDAKQAILEVEDFREAVILSAQTALRDAIGKNKLSTLLSDREKLGQEIREILDAKTNAWGITILSVEITDIIIPQDLENAMSKQAQAEREKKARVILGSAEVEIAEKFEKAARLYNNNPMALQLRAMNMIYEGIRDKGSMMIVPSSALDSMNMGTILGSAAVNGLRWDDKKMQFVKSDDNTAGKKPDDGGGKSFDKEDTNAGD